MREHERPSIDLETARLELCRRHVHAFGPTTPAAFAWWAGVPAREARKTFDVIGSELIPVDLAGHDAWVLAADEPSKNDHSPLQDWHHPNGLVVNGRVGGAWGRRGGQVTIKAVGPAGTIDPARDPRRGCEHVYTGPGDHRLLDHGVPVASPVAAVRSRRLGPGAQAPRQSGQAIRPA